MFLGIFIQKKLTQKKNSKTDYSYVTEKLKFIQMKIRKKILEL